MGGNQCGVLQKLYWYMYLCACRESLWSSEDIQSASIVIDVLSPQAWIGELWIKYLFEDPDERDRARDAHLRAMQKRHLE